MIEKFRTVAQIMFSCITLVIWSSELADADVIVKYEFTNAFATTVDPNAIASDVNFTDSSASIGISGVLAVVDAAIGATDAATAVSTDSFFQFSVTPNSGFEADLTSLVFDASTAAFAPSNGYVVRSSVDNYSTTLLSGPFDTTYPTFTTYTADLSGASFQNLAQATTFRVYTWKDTGINPAAAFDNVTINRSVDPAAIPEPSSFAYMGLFTLCVTGVRWYRRRKAGVRPVYG